VHLQSSLVVKTNRKPNNTQNLNSTIFIKLRLYIKTLIWTNHKPTNVRESNSTIIKPTGI
jgi:hypothetical protein